MHEILKVIYMLNGGSVIPEQSDESTRINLYVDIADLYVDEETLKYYFFADFKADIDNTFKDNLGQIEKATIGNTEAFSTNRKPTPSSSYLILFWKVGEINESLYANIIQLEENEYFFKKYVFYYTQEELEGFKQWYKEINAGDVITISKMLELLSESDIDYDAPQVQFVIRLLTKIPFWKLEFPRAVLNEFENIVSNKIDGMRGKGKEEIKQLRSMISGAIVEGMNTADLLGEYIYKQIMGE